MEPSQLPFDPNDMMLNETKQSSPGTIVAEIVAWIRAAITLILWLVIFSVVCLGGFVAIKSTWWAVRLILKAIGI